MSRSKDVIDITVRNLQDSPGVEKFQEQHRLHAILHAETSMSNKILVLGIINDSMKSMPKSTK